MTGTSRLLSLKEFSHLVSESLDIHNAPQPFLENTAVVSEASQKHRYSSFQRIFSRPTPTPGHPHGTPEDLSESPRKMITWPFTRSPRSKSRNAFQDEDNAIDLNDPAACHSTSPYTVTSPAATSTSSFGSMVPTHERLFQVTSRESDEPSQNLAVVAPLNICDLPTGSGHYVADSLHAVYGNGSATSILASRHRRPTDSSNQTWPSTSFEGTEASHWAANSEHESFDEDPTPRASSFGPRTALPTTEFRNVSLLTQRGRSQRLSVVVPSRNADVLALRPAVGVTPHAPSETESSSYADTSSPTSPVARGASPTFSTCPSTSGTSSSPPNRRISAAFPDIASTSNLEIATPSNFSSRQHKRPISRSTTPPPLPRPPPTGPLPAVPSSIPPVPPLPLLLSKKSMNTTPHPAISSPPRSTLPATGLPPSPPGGLRLPSRLSWVNSVRAVLPSPPASPTRTLKSLAGKTSYPTSPSKAEVKRPNELKRPTSIGVIEAADGAQVRRTKSILLLGSKSKSNASLGTKRVQIHADVNLDAAPSRKPRRKSSAATVGHPTLSSDSGLAITSMTSSELLVLRERRHSAPMLSSCGRDVPSADWTLSLPFCTDVPGNTILPSPLLTPQLKSECSLEEVESEDWTLCMPLKLRVGTPTQTAEGCDSECTLAETSETTQKQITMQLPTPHPSPTLSDVRQLDPEESVVVPEERPVSPASLGPHVGGLDLTGGRGKRASGWHVYGWFDEVTVPAANEEEEEEEAEAVFPLTVVPVTNHKRVKNHVDVFCRAHDVGTRHPSKDSMSTVSTSETMFYSARSSLLVG